MELIFAYREGGSFLYRYDPRLKLAALIFITVITFGMSLPGLTVCAAVLTAGLLIFGPPFADSIRLLFSAIKFIIFIAFILMVSGRFFAITEEGDGTVVPLLLRLFIWIIAGFLFTGTTSHRELRGTFYCLTRWIPVFPAATFAVMISVTLGTIPYFFSALRKSRETMNCRGKIPWYRPVRRIRALTLPLLTRLVQRSELMTESLIARGFSADREFGLERVSLRQLVVSILFWAILFGTLYLFNVPSCISRVYFSG